MFAALFLRLLGAPRRFLAAGLSVAVIDVLHAVLVGGEPSVCGRSWRASSPCRAAQAPLGWAELAWRRCAGGDAFFSPFLLWDVSFQLSFMAALASDAGTPVGEHVLFTLAALVTTLPVMAYHF